MQHMPAPLHVPLHLLSIDMQKVPWGMFVGCQKGWRCIQATQKLASIDSSLQPVSCFGLGKNLAYQHKNLKLLLPAACLHLQLAQVDGFGQRHVLHRRKALQQGLHLDRCGKSEALACFLHMLLKRFQVG